MRASVHLVFAADCEAAFRFYERVLGGAALSLFTYGESPGGDALDAEWRTKIVHGSIIVGGVLVSGADVRPEDYEPPRGFFVLLSVATRAQAKHLFTALAEGGSVRMPLQATFWSPAFGVLVDAFGVPWEVSCEVVVLAVVVHACSDRSTPCTGGFVITSRRGHQHVDYLVRTPRRARACRRAGAARSLRRIGDCSARNAGASRRRSHRPGCRLQALADQGCSLEGHARDSIPITR